MTGERVRDKTLVNKGLSREGGLEIPRITAVSGPGAGRALAMERVTATVGRHATNDLVLEDPRVSGVHSSLRRVDGRLHVRDAGSTNGTWLGAHRVAEIELAVGGEIIVGDTVLRVERDDSATAAGISANESFGDLVGTSPAMREAFATLERVAQKKLSVLFQGEHGTGKEEMARALVARSTRSGAPLVVVDLTSVPEALLDAVLFGQEKTATSEQTAGLFETAGEGTVFIDEVGALPMQLQSKLLRLLERQELTRVGGHVPLKADVRVLASTSTDLRHAIEGGRFREDLYFRLAQVRVFAPPLRDRIDDIPVLCEALLERVAAGTKLTVDEDAMRELVAHPWPGNVRELRNALERAAALSQGGVIRRSDVAGEGFGFRGSREERTPLDLSGTFKEAKDRAIERFESAYLAALMRRCNGNLSQASRESDLARHHLRDLLKKRELYGVAWDRVQD